MGVLTQATHHPSNFQDCKLWGMRMCRNVAYVAVMEGYDNGRDEYHNANKAVLSTWRVVGGETSGTSMAQVFNSDIEYILKISFLAYQFPTSSRYFQFHGQAGNQIF